MDAADAGFETYVIEDACRAIDTGGSLERAWADMTAAGVKRIVAGDTPRPNFLETARDPAGSAVSTYERMTAART